jgi:hypothetical protein
MSKLKPASKFKHATAKASANNKAYLDLQLTDSSDATSVACSTKYLAVNWKSSGAGMVAVRSLDQVRKVSASMEY